MKTMMLLAFAVITNPVGMIGTQPEKQRKERMSTHRKRTHNALKI